MDSRPATQASKGRHLLRSAIAEAVASDPAQRVLASIASAGLAQPNADLGGPRRRGRPHRRRDHRDHAADRHSRRRHIGPISAGGRCPALRAGTGDDRAPPSAAQAGAPVAPPTPPTAGTPVSTWDKVAQCESGGNWATSTGNGFHGGLQFTASTWRSFGGSGMPHQASRTEQIAVAERVLDAQGWKAWPACSRKLGLR